VAGSSTGVGRDCRSDFSGATAGAAATGALAGNVAGGNEMGSFDAGCFATDGVLRACATGAALGDRSITGAAVGVDPHAASKIDAAAALRRVAAIAVTPILRR
jgi:hypothetical protein